MPIEGPLRELGLPDVFQLLELSRKTGMLRVTSRLRDDEGQVFFEAGRVVQASLKSKPATPVDLAAVNERDLERKRRGQIETAVFDLMSWRIDEWSRIADKVPHLAVVPVLADVASEHESQLDLLPHEWEVLSLIDGRRDVQAIATALNRAEFDTAKVVYGLVTTGVVEIRPTLRVSASIPHAKPFVDPEIKASLNRGFAAARAGDLAAARKSWERFLALAPEDPAARRVRSALDAVMTLLAAIEAHDHG
jgi:hypothetical protein